jgi:predicted transcriptional regulator
MTCSTNSIAAQEVEYIREIMKMGTGADRQLDVYRKTGDMKAVVDYIIEETEVGVDEVDSLPTAKRRLMSLMKTDFDATKRKIQPTTEPATF